MSDTESCELTAQAFSLDLNKHGSAGWGPTEQLNGAESAAFSFALPLCRAVCASGWRSTHTTYDKKLCVAVDHFRAPIIYTHQPVKLWAALIWKNVIEMSWAPPLKFTPTSVMNHTVKNNAVCVISKNSPSDCSVHDAVMYSSLNEAKIFDKQHRNGKATVWHCQTFFLHISQGDSLPTT